MDATSILFGTFAPPLREQLPDAPLDEGEWDVFEHLEDSITRLYLSEIIDDSTRDRARDRLAMQIGNMIALATQHNG